MSPLTFHPRAGVTIHVSDPQIAYNFDPSSGDEYVLAKDFAISVMHKADSGMYESEIVVANGFVFDGASVPRRLWWFLGPTERVVIIAAIIHDWFYVEQPVSRWEADAKFRDLLQLAGMSRKRYWLAWLAVRLFGWRPWNRRRKQLTETET